MIAKVTIKLSTVFQRKLNRLSNLSGAAFMQAGRDTADWLRRYHTQFRLKWRGPRYMAGPASDFFWQQVVGGWQNPVVSGKRVTITNTFGLLSWKVSGGTITPKVARMLTIPVIPDAKGLTVQQFEIIQQTPLFRIGNALVRKVGSQLEAVYALKSPVVQMPWPGAMPQDDAIKQVFASSLHNQIRIIAK